VVSQANAWMGVSANPKWRSGSIRNMSNAAISTHRNAVEPAAVPAHWTMLVSQRLKSRNAMPRASPAVAFLGRQRRSAHSVVDRVRSR
jgi:hypothetical protein